eukprot:1353456-Amorphochlora_amoeboformis.AAC.1
MISSTNYSKLKRAVAITLPALILSLALIGVLLTQSKCTEIQSSSLTGDCKCSELHLAESVSNMHSVRGQSRMNVVLKGSSQLLSSYGASESCTKYIEGLNKIDDGGMVIHTSCVYQRQGRSYGSMKYNPMKNSKRFPCLANIESSATIRGDSYVLKLSESTKMHITKVGSLGLLRGNITNCEDKSEDKRRNGCKSGLRVDHGSFEGFECPFYSSISPGASTSACGFNDTLALPSYGYPPIDLREIRSTTIYEVPGTAVDSVVMLNYYKTVLGASLCGTNSKVDGIPRTNFNYFTQRDVCRPTRCLVCSGYTTTGSVILSFCVSLSFVALTLVVLKHKAVKPKPNRTRAPEEIELMEMRYI